MHLKVIHVMSNYCKYKLLDFSRLLSHADSHTIELSRTFHQVTHLLCNTSKKVLCKLLECSTALCEYIYRLTYVVVRVVVVVGGTTVLKALPKESYWGKLLISRNFGDSSEIVSVVRLCQWCARI